MRSDQYVESTEIIDGLRVQVVADQSYDWDMLKDGEPLGEFVVTSRNFEGAGTRDIDSEERDALERGGWRLLTRFLRMSRGMVCILPVSGYDHSGQTIWVASGLNERGIGDDAGWDSGQIGFIYATRERVEELGIPDRTRKVTQRLGFGSFEVEVSEVEAQLRGQIEEIDDLMTGNVWGIVISEPTPEAIVEADGLVEDIDEDDEDLWETVDSCWGFVGLEYAKDEGRREILANAKAEIEHRAKAPIVVEQS